MVSIDTVDRADPIVCSPVEVAVGVDLAENTPLDPDDQGMTVAPDRCKGVDTFV